MRLKIAILGLNGLLIAGLAQAEDYKPDFASAAPDSIQVVFPSKTPKKKNLGQLTLTSHKKKVKLEFEGTGLHKGQFKIVIADDCKIDKKKKNGNLTEIYSFNTLYGEISCEDNLPYEKLADIGLANKSIALIQIGKKQNQVIACSESKAP